MKLFAYGRAYCIKWCYLPQTHWAHRRSICFDLMLQWNTDVYLCHKGRFCHQSVDLFGWLFSPCECNCRYHTPPPGAPYHQHGTICPTVSRTMLEFENSKPNIWLICWIKVFVSIEHTMIRDIMWKSSVSFASIVCLVSVHVIKGMMAIYTIYKCKEIWYVLHSPELVLTIIK